MTATLPPDSRRGTAPEGDSSEAFAHALAVVGRRLRRGLLADRVRDHVEVQQHALEASLQSEVNAREVAPQLATMTAQKNEIDVSGNTDNVPIGRDLAERYPTNWELAGARASVVVRFLQESGVDPTNLRANSAGQCHPVGPNDSEVDREHNRRTDLLVRPQESLGTGSQ